MPKVEQTTHEDRRGVAPALTVSRRIDAPRSRVFAAFVEQEAFASWFGPQGVTVPECDWKPEVGRNWRVVLRHEDGSAFPASGIFREIVAEERLVLTWSWEAGGFAGIETLLTFSFRDLGGATEVTIIHEWLPDDEAREQHSRGWRSSLEALAAHFA